MSSPGLCATPILQQIETPRWDVTVCHHKADKLVGPDVYPRNEIDVRLAIAAALDAAGIAYNDDGSITISVSRHYPEAA